MVSFTDASTAGFALKAGQSHTTSDKCMTKLDAFTKYNVSASAMSAYLDYQLPPKSVWVSGVVGNSITVYQGDHGTNATCAMHPSSRVVYSTSTVIAQGVILYQDSSMTSLYNNTFVHYDTVSNSLFTINLSGVVSVLTSCVNSFMYDGYRGSLGCSNNQITLFNPISVTVYCATNTVSIGSRLYNDAGLTSPYTRGQIVKIGNQLYQLNTSGVITTYYDAGDPC